MRKELSRSVRNEGSARAPLNAAAVVRVGGGRGFVVEHLGQRFVITAAHCLPKLPPAHPWSNLEERTYKKLLAPLGAKRTIWAECRFADPVADIAILCTPDSQDLHEEAAAYEELVASPKPFAIADALKMGREMHSTEYGSFANEVPGKGEARLLALDGEWIVRPVVRHRHTLAVENGIASGMSGSPILSMDGKAIAVVSADQVNPVLRDCLRAWLSRRRP